MRVTVRTLKQGWSAEIDVPDVCLVGELRAACARAATISPPSRCKLVLRGAALADDALVAPLKPDDTVLVAARPAETPGPSPGGASGGVNPGGLFRRRVEAGIAAFQETDSDDDDARTARGETPPLELSRPRLFLYGVLVRKMRAPAWLARALASVSTASAAKAAAWVVLSQVFAYLEHAPLFLLATGFYLIFTGLGTRRPGEPSAYSVFNGFNELPGTFNAARVDDAILRRNGVD
jgi:hypothetical protein